MQSKTSPALALLEGGRHSGQNTKRNETIVERTADRELVVTRTFNAQAHVVFDAWTKPELLKRWWAPKSFGVSLFECESDLRVGGTYRNAFGRDPTNPEVFSGRYVEVNSPSRLVLTQVHERMSDAGEAVPLPRASWPVTTRLIGLFITSCPVPASQQSRLMPRKKRACRTRGRFLSLQRRATSVASMST